MKKLRHFDGSAVSEGIRLEVGKYTVFAVRNTKRDISVRQRKEPRRMMGLLIHIPFLRGITRLFRDIVRFFDGISESRELKPARPVRGTRVEQKIASALKIPAQSIVTLISAILIPLILFCCMYAAPMGVQIAIHNLIDPTYFRYTLIMSLTRCIFALFAIWAILHLRVINRLLMYKCAFNKALNCYECKDDVIPGNVKRYPRYARRSEPAFLLSVFTVSLFIFPFIRSSNIAVYAVTRLLIIPVVAAIINEPISALENARLTKVVQILRAPLDAFQRMTTIEPDSRVIEVVVCAFQTALGEIEEVKENDDNTNLAEES